MSIRVTRNLTQGLRPEEHSVEAVLALMQKATNLYELTNNDSALKTVVAREGLNRVYGDIDLMVPDEATMRECDAIIGPALLEMFESEESLNTRCCLMTASGFSVLKQQWKVSWRFTMPTIVGKKRSIKLFLKEIIEERMKAFLVDLPAQLWEAFHLDMSIYSNNWKMRMLGSSKDGENRPLRLVHGSPADTLITLIPEDAQVLADVPETQVASTAQNAPLQDPTQAALVRAHLANVGNKDMAWDEWYQMGQIIFNTLGDEAGWPVFDEWSKGSKKYCATVTAQQWRSLTLRTDGPKLTIASLYLRSKEANAEEFNRIQRTHLLQELFDLCIVPPTRHEYDARYCHDLPLENHSTLAIKAMLGTGKTTAIIRALKPYRRILFISGRRSFTSYAHAELAREGIHFSNYMNAKGALAHHDLLFIQVESLWRLESDFNKYDLVILDESETICHQLHSIETNKDRLIKNHEMLGCIVATADKLIAADAFLSDRTMSLLRSLRNWDQTALIVNTHQPYQRTAVCLQTTATDARRSDLGSLVARIRAAIKAKRKIIVVWTSRRKGQAFADKYLKGKDIKWRFYNSTSNAKERAELQNVSETWRDLDVLMYTSTITVGVSYDPADPKDQFDEAFLYASNASAVPRDVAQSLLRCRKLRLNRLTYTVEGRAPHRPDYGRHNVAVWAQEKKRMLSFAYPTASWQSAPAWVNDNFVANENEHRLSRNFYAQVLLKYLKLCGYQQETSLGNLEIRLEPETLPDWQGIPLLTALEAAEIADRVQAEEATQDEKVALLKYKVQRRLKADAPEDVGPTIWRKFFQADRARAFWNIASEKQVSMDALVDEQAENRYDIFVESQLMQRTMLNRVLALLEMPHSQTGRLLTHEQLEAVVPELAKLENEARVVFGMRKSRRKGEEFDARAAKDLVDTLWKAWSGVDGLVVIEKKRVRNGKALSWRTDYAVGTTGIWEHLAEPAM